MAGVTTFNKYRSAPPGYEPDPRNPGQVRRPGGMDTPLPGSPQNPMQVGPTAQQVLQAGGAWQKTPQDGTGVGPDDVTARSSFSMPVLGYGPPNPYQAARDTELDSRRSSLLKSAMSGLAGGFSGGGAPTGTAPPVQFPQVSMAMPDVSGAQTAAFGAAKAKAGALGRSALGSLRSELAERGIIGGGTEARGLVDTLAGATNPLSDLNVAQQGEALGIAERNQALAAQQAATQYQGGIAQRGQDIGQQQFNAQLAQQKQLELLRQALAGLSRSY